MGNSHAVVAVREEVSRLLQRQAGGRSLPPILIQGETGTGKGLLAGAIHRAGPRPDGPFVAVNCAAIPDTLLEAELFGFERGAFTDARQAKPGLVQTAHRGTLFLDEIGLLPGPLQGKLLTVLEDRAVRRLGRTRSEPVDVAILAATSEDLERAARERRFTEALYHRLSVVTLRLPPLRERGADILLLAEHFLARAGTDYNVPSKNLAPEARTALLAYPWPGNVRELSNRMERVTLLAEPGLVTCTMLGLPETSPVDLREAAPPQDARPLRDRIGGMVRDSLIEALTATGGNITRAAARLGVAPTTLRYRIKKLRPFAEPPPGQSPPELTERATGPASQPVGDAVPATVPSPRTLDARAGNLPTPAAPLIAGKGESEALPSSVPLNQRCPNCGVENPSVAEFCGRCTTSLSRPTVSPFLVQADRPPPHQHEQPTDGGPESPGRVAAEAERRQLTVMSCGLAGLSAQLDPEDRHEVLQAFQSACSEVIHRFEGHIAQYLGDGLLLYFGYPLAHEDDALRAVRTGLGIVEEIGKLSNRFERERGIRLAVRLAIHTDVVVMGEMGVGDKRCQIALGEAPDIATQLQGLADSDTVVISSATYRLIEGYFSCHPLNGLTPPLTVYRVLQESTAQSRLDVAVAAGLTPLVGREQELELLWERWERAKDGLGQVVLLSGEPGIGKSRLVQVLKERIGGEPYTRLEFRCSPYYQNSALYPVIENLQHVLKFRGEDSPQEKLSKLEGTLEGYGFSLEEAVPIFASLLSLPWPKGYRPLALTPQRQKQKTLEAVLAWLLKEIERQALLSVWEDLQWVDPSTLDLLRLLLEQAPTARLLTLLTFRSDFTPPWATRSNWTHITLGRLTRRQAETMVQRVAGDKGLPTNLITQLIAKTDGVPLFVEELTKAVLESHLVHEEARHDHLAGSLPTLTIPSSLHDSLMARLDRLGTGKQVAQLGAIVGREFSYELLQAVSPVDEPTLQRELAQLVSAELLYQKGFPPQARYVFKHALIQEAAYQSLVKNKKRGYHRHVAQVLEERFPETRETHPELLAHHYAEGGLRTEAIVFLWKAGQRAIERSANEEAIVHLSRGLELLTVLAETPERGQQELDFQISLGGALTVIRGSAALEVEGAYVRAHSLCQNMADVAQRIHVLSRLATIYDARGKLQRAQELGEECLVLAKREQDSEGLRQAHQALGRSLYWQGQIVAARLHLESAFTLSAWPKDRSLTLSVGRFHPPEHSRMTNLCMTSLILYVQGYADQARKRNEEALTLAEGLSHPYSLAAALLWATWLHIFCGERHVADNRVGAALALATQYGFPLWEATGTILQGWMLVVHGQGEDGIAQMRRGLLALRTMGVEQAAPSYLILLADAYGKVGQTSEGLSVLDEALCEVNKTGARWEEAALYRIKGELLVAHSVECQSEAESCLRQGFEVARRQQAKSFELRAATSLSRLWRAQGKREEASRMLAEVYGWFTEGFDTSELREAKELLDELR